MAVEDNGDGGSDHYGEAYKSGGGCRLMPIAGADVIVEEWPK